MRSGAAWVDVCIVNLSLRGAGLQSASPPARGSYVEIRRASSVIIGRVIWTNGHRFGIRAQDRLPIDAIVAEPKGNERAAPKGDTGLIADRRAVPRLEHRHDASRHIARVAEFACLAIVGSGAAIGFYGAIERALAHPISTVSSALAVGR